MKVAVFSSRNILGFCVGQEDCFRLFAWLQDELAEIGLKLGADVPIFVHGQAAFAEGVGEKIQYCEPQDVYKRQAMQSANHFSVCF